MKKIIRSNVVNLPYSLHDGAVIDFEVVDDRLVMKFQYGYVKTVEPFEQVSGNVEFEKVDWDFSFVYLLEYKDCLCGNVGSFTGEKMELKEFINKFGNAKFDIIDETYGHNISKLDGYFIDKDSIKECRMEIYHLGDMSYIVDE